VRYEILALFPFCVYTKLVYVVNVPSNYRWVPQKGKSCYNLAVAVEKSTTGHFPKGQSKSSGETSNLLIVNLPSFFLQLGNFLLSSPGLFFLSRHSRKLSSIYRKITPSCPGLSRGKSVFPQELPPDPWGELLTTLRAGASIPAKSHPHRSPGVQLPAATSTAATTVRAFHSLRKFAIRNGRFVPLICYLVDAQVRWIFIKQLAIKIVKG
jgi:hypothetical protein